MGSEPEKTEKPQDTLDRILAALRGTQARERLAALRELGELNYTSPAILLQLERIALTDASPPVREAALAALSSPASQFVQKETSRLNPADRQLVLEEIKSWQSAGLIGADTADVLKHRYDFVAVPVNLKATPAAAPAPAKVVPAAPSAPRPTLTQTLLSETSIRIALYLGAFLVIAAAAILAALVEAARLPILVVVTVAFGAAAFVLRRRLPQPSFVLFIVFSCLLPFDAAVIQDYLNLQANASELYWALTFAVLAAIWAGATWLFNSRFFSLTAFLALVLSALQLAAFVDLEAEPTTLLASLAGGLGLLAVYILKRWRDDKFALPLFSTVVVHMLIVATTAGVIQIWRAVDTAYGNGAATWSGNLAVGAVTWLTIAAFFVAANLLYPFLLFPWAATLFLLPAPVALLQFTGAQPPAYIAVLWILGAAYLAASEWARLAQQKRPREYYWPFLAAAYLPLMVAWTWGAAVDVRYGFAVALGSAVAFGVLTIRSPRVLPWTSTLVTTLISYFTLFGLPALETLHVPVEYALTGAAVLLLLPDMFLAADLYASQTLRWPARVLGLLVAVVTLLFIASGQVEQAGSRASLLLIFGLLAFGYAFRYSLKLALYVACGLLPLALLQALGHFNVSAWLPAMTVLAVIYYVAGSVLKNKLAEPLRNSSLALTSLAIAIGLAAGKQTEAAWSSVIATALFAVEQYRYKQSGAEAGIFIFATIVSWHFIPGAGSAPFAARLLGISVVWLGLDLLISKIYLAPRTYGPLVVIGCVGLTIMAAAYLLAEGASNPRLAALGFGIYAIVFAANALLRESPRLGYAALAALPLSGFYILHGLLHLPWLLPLVAIAILYYVVGCVARARDTDPAGRKFSGWPSDRWSSTWLMSGLVLGTLIAFIGPSQGSWAAALAASLAATLWAAEAFFRRSVWLGFPSNGLYLMAYFLILGALDVDQPQFYSVGAAALGLLMHYLLTRSGSRTAAFVTGMVSQLVLLGTTYIQMLSTEQLGFFVVLFFQGLAVLFYGIVIRSRSLVVTPLGFVVLGVITVIYSALKGMSTVVLIGCTGIVLLLLGILAVVLRERLTKIGERFSTWQA